MNRQYENIAAVSAIARQSKSLSQLRLILVMLLMLVASFQVSASFPADGVEVGKVSFVLGKAYIIDADGNRLRIKLNSVVGVNDTIETYSDAHVHVRFKDQAKVSVRPSSRLEIVRYDYDAANPADSAVKFNLIEGVTRAISGEAAKNARQNFRMNTPIAAIGVRGTDFSVSASPQAVRALVNEGAIVVAPYSIGCSAATFGPCSQNSVELAGGASRIVEFNAGAVEPNFLPMPGSAIPEEFLEHSLPVMAETGKTEHEEEGGSDLYSDSVTTLAVNKKIEGSQALLEPTVTVIPKTDLTPASLKTEAELVENTQLVWGRWSEQRSQINERITTSYELAFAEGREATVSNSSYALFRTEEGPLVVKPGLGVVAFNLVQAQATLNTASGKELMQVYGGLLNINFVDNQFSTSLDLSHSATGDIQYTDDGRLFDGGYFRNRSGEKVTVGAVSLDGTEAGFAFEQTLEAGKIEGITLWSNKP